MRNSRAIYQDRINRVIDYVETHLDRPLALEELAGVAFFSTYHFHRIFLACTGETVHAFTHRSRLEKAARLLWYSGDSVTTIAFACGYSSPAAFTRAFKKHFVSTPREFRKKGPGPVEKSKIGKETFPIQDYILPMSKAELRAAFPVQVRSMPERRVAFFRITGAYEEDRVLAAYRRLVAWARRTGLFATETFLGMSLDDPMVTPRSKYRYDACLTLPRDFPFEEHATAGLSERTLPACRHAVTRISGDLKKVATAFNYLYRNWLMDSPYEPEHQHGREVFLDSSRVCDWSSFDLDLCIPVRPLRAFAGQDY